MTAQSSSSDSTSTVPRLESHGARIINHAGLTYPEHHANHHARAARTIATVPVRKGSVSVGQAAPVAFLGRWAGAVTRRLS